MTTVSELQRAIPDLSEADYSELHRWLLDQHWERRISTLS